MILQTISDIFLAPLARFAALILIILGIMWLIYGAYEGKRRGSFKERKVKDWDYKITKFLQVLTYLGFLVGIIGIITGVSGIMLNEPPSLAYAGNFNTVNYFTSILLIIIGIFTFLKPANDMPIATIIALLAGFAVVIVLSIIMPLSSKVAQIIDVFVSAKVVFIVIFIIVFSFTAILVKFYSAGIMSLSKAISWPPFCFIIAIFCLLQGVFLAFGGVSIIPI